MNTSSSESDTQDYSEEENGMDQERGIHTLTRLTAKGKGKCGQGQDQDPVVMQNARACNGK